MSERSDIWSKVTKTDPTHAIISIFGDVDTGKSTLALTSRGPMAYVHEAEKLELIVDDALDRGVDISDFSFAAQMSLDVKTRMKYAKVLVEQVSDALTDAVEWAKTTVVDTETALYELFRVASLGGSTTQRGAGAASWVKAFGDINFDYGTLIKMFRGQGEGSLILISGKGDEYINDKKTGERVRAGHKHVEKYANVVLETQRDDDGKFSVIIRKPWAAGHLRNKRIGESGGKGVLECPLTVPDIMGLLTETDPVDWGA